MRPASARRVVKLCETTSSSPVAVGRAFSTPRGGGLSYGWWDGIQVLGGAVPYVLVRVIMIRDSNRR